MSSTTDSELKAGPCPEFEETLIERKVYALLTAQLVAAHLFQNDNLLHYIIVTPLPFLLCQLLPVVVQVV